MTIQVLETYHAIYEDEHIADLIGLCMFQPTEGKIQNIAQTVYAKTQGFMLVASDEDPIAILGGSRINRSHFIIRYVAVKEDARQQGHARALFEALLKALPIETLEADADSTNYGFFRKLGFQTKKSICPITEQLVYHCTYTKR